MPASRQRTLDQRPPLGLRQDRDRPERIPQLLPSHHDISRRLGHYRQLFQRRRRYPPAEDPQGSIVGNSEQPPAKPKLRPGPVDRPVRSQKRLLDSILRLRRRQHPPTVSEQRLLISQHDRFERRDATPTRQFHQALIAFRTKAPPVTAIHEHGHS
jgi:hypothetical protein